MAKADPKARFTSVQWVDAIACGLSHNGTLQFLRHKLQCLRHSLGVLGHFVSPAEKVPLNLIELILAQGSMHTARVSPPFLMTTEA